MPQEPSGTPTLNRAAKAALQGQLDQLLSTLQVVGDWPDLTNYRDLVAFHEALSAHEPWRSNISLFDLMDVLSLVLRRGGVKSEGTSPAKLADLLDSERFESVAVGVRSYLLSIPRQYSLWVALPAMPHWGAGSVPISDHLELVEIGGAPKTGRTKVAESLAGYLANSRGEPYGVYARVTTKGFASRRLDTTAVADGISQLKQFFQMFRRTEAFNTQYFPGFLGGGPRIECWIEDVEFPKDRMSIQLPQAMTKFLSAVSVNEDKLQVLDLDNDGSSPAKTLLGRGYRKPRTRDEWSAALAESMSWVKRLHNCPPSEDINRIRSAFEWAFDSEEGDNQTLSLLQACIGLEALLGDDEKDEPLVARLRDRCAYLLGQNHADREGIRKRFSEIYEVRSKVVHGRRRRLSMSDAKKLYDAQTMLGEVITEEARRLLRGL